MLSKMQRANACLGGKKQVVGKGKSGIFSRVKVGGCAGREGVFFKQKRGANSALMTYFQATKRKPFY
jgi:hypothetical protein